jgi:hypothetical protein
MTTDIDFKKHNARGAITYSQFTMPQALAANENSKFKKANLDEVAPVVQMLLDAAQLEKLTKHIVEVFLPECVRRNGAGEKRDIFDAKVAAKIEQALINGAAGEWDAPPHLPVKSVYAKTLTVAPWAVATLKVTGNKGRDFDLQARVNSEDELKVPDPDILSYPLLRPIGQTVHELYPGAWAYATLSLAAWTMSASNYGISAYANTIVFLEDRDRLAGTVGLDEEDVFMDE